MNRIEVTPNWKLYSWLAAVSAILYLLVQVLPATAGAFFGSGSEKVIAKSEAERRSAAFLTEQFGLAPNASRAYHQSDKLLYGYLAKEKLTEDYGDRYDRKFPTDTYQVTSTLPGEYSGELYVYVHMESGQIISWHKPHAADAALPEPEQRIAAAVDFAIEQGFKRDALKAQKQLTREGDVRLDVAGEAIGEAKLSLLIGTESKPDGGVLVTRYAPVFQVPADYEAYVEEQDALASSLSLFGSTLMSLVLFILAVIYAALYRKHTSFVRGWLVAAIFLGFYLINNFNMIDGLAASFGEMENARTVALIGMIVQSFITVVMAASVYFSLVGGDGLWRSMGWQLWPRSSERGYGEHMWNSMKLGYLLAFILLAVQTVILLILENATDAWATTDVMQSPYNFGAPWLFPLLAWCAAISEEAVFRFFAIGLLKKWLRSTFVAALIPTVIWALGHVTYAIYPSTTRLIELTLLGLLFSYFFLRFGLAAVIFAHAIFDSVMMAISLMFLGQPVNIALGLFYIVLPVGVAAVLRRLGTRKGRKPPLTVPPSTLQ
ncbi:CPBP family intramembrane glutamic endopeptidase [Paenibacillus xanthanilyticus]|uniref:CPBP family intramembrane glutamic endopeptidase n=1 Tax=Paenibacillus xanthanilyticus TaxID=1783531 RepID=A0ABV8KAF7_9BACL